MSKKVKLAIFIVCVSIGLYLQLRLGIRCRCPYGYWHSQFYRGALVLNVFALAHCTYTVFRGKFFEDCLRVGAVILTSSMWIPLVYRGTTSLILFYDDGHFDDLGHWHL